MKIEIVLKQSENKLKSEKEIKNFFLVLFTICGGSKQGDDSNRHGKVSVTVVTVLMIQTVTYASSGDDRHACADVRLRVYDVSSAFFHETKSNSHSLTHFYSFIQQHTRIYYLNMDSKLIIN